MGIKEILNEIKKKRNRKYVLTKKLRAKWSRVMAEDLKIYTSIDINESLEKILVEEFKKLEK